jgi:hypothetical protein
VSTEAQRVTLANDEVPDANASWWISEDEGVTKIPVKFIKREKRVMGGWAWIFLMKC